MILWLILGAILILNVGVMIGYFICMQELLNKGN
jgi:uncharacterized protein YneF (UPF0154 family)